MYPVVRDTSTIKLTDGTNTTTLTSTTAVVTNATQTLTNKTLDSTSNTFTADKLRTSTGTITINSATAPSTWQVLTATSGSTATWQTVSTSSSTLETVFALKAVNIEQFTVVNGIYQFQCDNISDAYAVNFTTQNTGVCVLFLPFYIANGRPIYVQANTTMISNMTLVYADVDQTKHIITDTSGTAVTA